MAVELDVRLTRPCNAEAIRSKIEEVLLQRLRISVRPDVRMCIQRNQSEKNLLSEHEAMVLSIDGLAEVSIMPYSNPSDSSSWACISYAQLRSPESKILCLAAAVVLAKHNGVVIQDESDVFGCGTRIDPDHAFAGFDDIGDSADFAKQVMKAIQLLDMRHTPPAPPDLPPSTPRG